MHKEKKEVLVKKRIRVELTLLEKLSNTDPEDNSVQTLMIIRGELQMGSLNQKGPLLWKVYKLQENKEKNLVLVVK